MPPSHAAAWRRYPSCISLVARPPSARDHACRVALPKDCDAFWWLCSMDGDCPWGASFRRRGLRPCRLGRTPTRRKKHPQLYHHRRELPPLVRRLHDQKPTRERGATDGGCLGEG